MTRCDDMTIRETACTALYVPIRKRTSLRLDVKQPKYCATPVQRTGLCNLYSIARLPRLLYSKALKFTAKRLPSGRLSRGCAGQA